MANESLMAKFRLNCAKKTAHLGAFLTGWGSRVQIPSAPHLSLQVLGHLGELIEIGARRRDFAIKYGPGEQQRRMEDGGIRRNLSALYFAGSMEVRPNIAHVEPDEHHR